MGVRKIPKNYRNTTGVISDSKNCTRHGFESTLERDFLSMLNNDCKVDRYETQPVKITWIAVDGKNHHYTPDVLVKYAATNKSILYEVKYRSELREKWSELKPKFKAAIAYCRQQGWRFKIITEVEVRGTALKNIKFLNGYLIFNNSRDIQDKCQKLLANIENLVQTTPETLLGTISTEKMEQAEWIPALWHLVATQQILVDLSNPLNLKSLIWSK